MYYALAGIIMENMHMQEKVVLVILSCSPFQKDEYNIQKNEKICN